MLIRFLGSFFSSNDRLDDINRKIENMITIQHDLQLSQHQMNTKLPQHLAHLTITPSEASAPKSDKYFRILDELGIQPPELTNNSYDDSGAFTEFGFIWTWRHHHDENSCYEPFCVAYNAFRSQFDSYNTAIIVANGQHLYNGNLFKTHFYSLRKYDPLNNSLGDISFRGTVIGRTDIVINRSELRGGSIIRKKVGFVIEVKKSSELSTSSKLSSGIREATIQLLGLCGDNQYCTPTVILTDFTKHFVVLYLSLVSSHPDLEFTITAQKCSNIRAALNLAMTKSEEPCITTNFGRSKTPPHSSISDNSE